MDARADPVFDAYKKARDARNITTSPGLVLALTW
jgi:hypothetical protein